MDENGLRFGSWAWNEGLVTCLTNFALEANQRVLRNPERQSKDPSWITSTNYARRWATLLEGARRPEERLEILTTTGRRLNKLTNQTSDC